MRSFLSLISDHPPHVHVWFSQSEGSAGFKTRKRAFFLFFLIRYGVLRIKLSSCQPEFTELGVWNYWIMYDTPYSRGTEAVPQLNATLLVLLLSLLSTRLFRTRAPKLWCGANSNVISPCFQSSKLKVQSTSPLYHSLKVDALFTGKKLEIWLSILRHKIFTQLKL